MVEAHTGESPTSFEPPGDGDAVGTPSLLPKDRIFLSVAAVIAISLGTWRAANAISHGQRGMQNDHLAAIYSGTLAIGLFAVSIAAISLAAGVSGFHESHDARSTRASSILTVILATLLGGILVVCGVNQAIFLVVSCLIWFCTFMYERNHRSENSFRPLRWPIRSIAVILALPFLAGSASFIFDGLNLYNKLHLKLSIPVFSRMPANIPESDAMIIGDLCIGVPSMLLSLLLLREAFRGFVLFGSSLNSSTISK
ncbi:MAG: hypothetical protein ABJZ55_12640 [Fuerstiella sp.]